ncbi:MAG: hypothetical protein NXH73_05340 [Flavobacteriaceae bacterium]|nr:hypothetical protein [Flavobacteriaceae bacterium]
MKSNKNTWIPLLTLLLVFLQPAISFGNVPTTSSEIINNQEELTFFKTKGVKALVLQEITVASPEVIVISGSGNKSLLFDNFYTLKSELPQTESSYLIDFRGILTTQIFPFHFFL